MDPKNALKYAVTLGAAACVAALALTACGAPSAPARESPGDARGVGAQAHDRARARRLHGRLPSGTP